jgi:hypothetical protein
LAAVVEPSPLEVSAVDLDDVESVGPALVAGVVVVVEPSPPASVVVPPVEETLPLELPLPPSVPDSDVESSHPMAPISVASASAFHPMLRG